MAELAALISRTAEAWGPGRGVMESFQAYLFKTSAYLNAARGFGEFTSCSGTATPPKMRRSWDHAHAPSVVRYLILTPNRARSASVSGRFACFDHLWTPDGWGLLSWSDRGSVTTCEMHSSLSSLTLTCEKSTYLCVWSGDSIIIATRPGSYFKLCL